MIRQAGPLDPGVFARVFEQHHEGVQVLEALIQRFHARGAFVTGGEDGRRETDRRLGQREVVEYILKKINAAHGVPDDNNDEEENDATR